MGEAGPHSRAMRTWRETTCCLAGVIQVLHKRCYGLAVSVSLAFAAVVCVYALCAIMSEARNTQRPA
jgi:hypothetical protein